MAHVKVQLKDYLYKNYHQKQANSSEASSYWRNIGGSKVSVDEKNNSYNLKGWGFGYFTANNIFNKLKNAPSIFLTKKFLKEFSTSPKTIDALNIAIQKSNRLMDIDCARQALTIDYLQKKNIVLDNKVICIIGDGYGFLGILLKVFYPTCKIVYCNLGTQLFFDLYYSEQAFPQSTQIILKEPTTKIEQDFTFVEAESSELLAGLPIDFFFNIASMQEMNPEITEKYFNLMRKSSSSEVYFYSCNRDEKVLPDGTVIKHNQFPWGNSKIIINEICPWQHKFPTNKPPFWCKYDGTITHKLVQLK